MIRKKNILKLKGYVFSRPFMGERAPQHIQNLVLRDYCAKNNYNYLLSSTEYCMNNAFLNLNSLIKDLANYDGIVSYSLFQLPEVLIDRLDILKKIVIKKKQFHFALEDIALTSLEDIEKINDIWLIKQHI